MATQAQVDSALKIWQDAASKEQTLKATYSTFRQQYLSCKAKRDEKSTGWGKNKACHIDLLNTYLKGWDTQYKAYQIAVGVTKDKKANYDRVKAEWDEQVAQQQAVTEQQIELQMADPDIQIAQAEKEEAIAIADKEQKAKNQRFIIIGVVAVIVIVGSVIIIKVFK